MDIAEILLINKSSNNLQFFFSDYYNIRNSLNQQTARNSNLGFYFRRLVFGINIIDKIRVIV
jgi:hypothetical protein